MVTIEPGTREGERIGMSRYCDSLEARIAKLEAALQPFAALADQVAREAITSPTDATVGLLSIQFADLRRASSALHGSH